MPSRATRIERVASESTGRFDRTEYLIRRLTERGGEGFAILDREGRVLLPGPSVLGYQRQDFSGRSALDLAHPEDRLMLLETLQSLLANPAASARTEYRARHADGSWHRLEVVGRNLLEDPVVAGIVVNFRDITEHRLAEQRMAAQYQVTRVLAESSGIREIVPRVLAAIGETLEWLYAAYWNVDRQGDVLRHAGSWRAPRLQGALALESHDEVALSKEDSLLVRVSASGRPVWVSEFDPARFPRAHLAQSDGFQSALLFPVLHGAEVIGVMEFLSDEARPADAELLRTMEVAASQIGQFLERKSLEEQLRVAQKLESLGVLAGGIAHDFNNLLTGIMGNVSLASQLLPADNGARAYLKDALEGTESAAGLTQQLLAYAGKGKFVVQTIDLSALAGGMRALVERSIPKNVTLEFELAADLPAAEGDPGQLQQVILNLILNGAEAIGHGHGTVSIRTGRLHVDAEYLRGAIAAPAAEAGADYIYFAVRDTGCGMASDMLPRIFDPFFTTKFTGRGLGLAAVLGIVRSHRGVLKVDSAPGQGSEFRVLFPACPAAAPPRSEHTSSAEAAAKPAATILVVDDEELVRRIAASALEYYGYRILAAADGTEAVKRFAAEPDCIDLVLLDLTMPGLSGEETLRELQRIRPEVKVLLSSGYDQVEATQHFAGQGLAGFLKKPYVAPRLAQAVRAVLGDRPAQE